MENIEKKSNPEDPEDIAKTRLIAIGHQTPELLESVGIVSSDAEVVLHCKDLESWKSFSKEEQADLVVIQ